MSQSWSIVVFCYNEAGSVGVVIERILRIFDEHRRGHYEVIVVDDGSIDGSALKIEAARVARPDVIRVITHEKNLGIGRALRDGYAAAMNENLTAVPADGQFNVDELVPYLDIEKGTFVSFYRLENAQYTRFRTLLSGVNKYINKAINGIELKDINWVKIYKREAITAFPWKLQSSIVESEICAKLLIGGNRCIEILSYYHPRRSGKSKGASPRIIFQALQETLKLIMVVRQYKRSLRL